ncbi:MAG TPA: S1 RNA-binding domain-containing protein [Vicinamibacterales bacterium]|nr:S1 RNA-binding domain-containing protein [Vicinamibacterales bacterium]
MTDSGEDFASLFEASLKAKRIEQGQTIEGTIVAIGPEVAFVDVGGKGEATIDVGELKDDEGDIEVSVGDRIQAVVVSTSGGITLSRRLARGAATARQLEEAFHSGLPVEGRVEKAVKGGYEVRIGGVRAFCPFSQIDIVRGTEPSVHEGKVYTFRIIEYKEGGRNLILSRRALLEEEQRANADEVRRSIVEGAVLKGRIASVREFGAFVDLGGGVQGLLHISEMGWSRVTDPSQVVKPGEEITVKVLQVDDAKQKISLGLKQLAEDPWSRVGTTYAVGQVVMGRVTRVTEFGAFVELEPGVEALAHASAFPPTGRAGGWKVAVRPGTEGAFEILNIDLEKKRIGVAPVPEGSTRAGASEIAPGARVRGTVERYAPFGVFVFLAPGRTGLIPMSETGVSNEADVAKIFPVGSDVEVVVLDVDEASRRIRLSVKAIAAAQEAAEVREYTEREGGGSETFGGSLADKLRGALKSRDT